MPISDCLFTNNQALVGGAVFVEEHSNAGGYVTVTRCRFIGNTATTRGGAFFSNNGEGCEPVVLSRCVFIGNASPEGAAVGGNTYWNGEYRLENCLVYGNTGGYAVHQQGSRVTATTYALDIAHCTIVGNPGGGVRHVRDAGAGLRVRNSIIATNGTTGIYYDRKSGAYGVFEYNDVLDQTTNYGKDAAAGAGSISSAPLFVDAVNGDYRLAFGSPCIDAGTNLAVFVDRDGVSRPTRFGYDIGAYEEWQIPIIASRAAVAQPTAAEVRAEFTYESAAIATYAYFVIDTADQGTNSLAAWWQSAGVGEKSQGGIFGASFSGLSPETTYFYRCMASNSYDVMWGPVASFKTPASGGATRLWTGLGGSALATNVANWLGGVAPAAGDYIVLDGSPSNLTWNAAATQTVGSWTQTENYTGTVTFETTYPSFGTAFTNFTVTGDAVLARGTWTHLGHSSTPIKQNSDATRRYRLRVTVAGDLTLGPSAKIDLFGRGLVNDTMSDTIRGTLGGQRSNESGDPPLYNRTTSDSLTAPEAVGRGGDWGGSNARFGGGAVWLTVDGASVIEGEILARAGTWSNPTITPRSGSGGSIWLQTGTLAGNGLLDASNGDSTSVGGGGRVSVVVSNGTSFGSVRLQAFGGGAGPAAAGTVYKEHAGHAAGQGILVLDNNNQTHSLYSQPYYAYGVTLMPDAANGGPVNLNAFAEVIVTNRAILGVNTDTVLDWSTANLRLHNRNQSFIAIRGTGGVTWPATFTIGGFTLLLDVDPNATGNWTVTADGRIARTFARERQNASDSLGYPFVPGLVVTLNGDLTVQSGGEVTVQRMGYFSDCGIGRPLGGRGACHGGQGGDADGVGGKLCYGSILRPITYGSGGAWGSSNFSPGGGRMRLTVTGATTLDGALDARPEMANNYNPAGGSVWLTTGTLSGNGNILVTGRDAVGGQAAGGGGRIAVYLTQGNDVGSVVLDARGGTLGYPGAAGTVYLQKSSETAGRGEVHVWNNGRTTVNAATLIPPDGGAMVSDVPPVYGAFSDNLTNTMLRVTDNGRVKLTANLTVRDLQVSTNSYLVTGAFTLTVDAREHHLDDPTKFGIGQTTMVDTYANIVWTGVSPGTLILLR